MTMYYVADLSVMHMCGNLPNFAGCPVKTKLVLCLATPEPVIA